MNTSTRREAVSIAADFTERMDSTAEEQEDLPVASTGSRRRTRKVVCIPAHSVDLITEELHKASLPADDRASAEGFMAVEASTAAVTDDSVQLRERNYGQGE